MLLLNKVQVTVRDIEKKLSIIIPLEKILKKPLFEINPALIFKDDRNNGAGAQRVREGMEFPAYFRTRLDNGENVEIRYCTNRVPDTKTNGQTEIFSPKKLPFIGKAEFIDDDEDKAVYYFLHFYNKQSPFREEGYQFFGKPFEYEFQDDNAKADAQIAVIQLRNRATTHASNLEGNELMIIAKGMRINAEGMEPLMVKAQLMQRANDNPSAYLEKAKSQVNHIEGLIFDAIDKGIFVLENLSTVKRWKWAMGAKKDQVIVELPTSTPNFKEALITHIQQTAGVVNEFLPALIDTRLLLNAKTNVTNALAGVNVLDMIKAKENNTSDNFQNPDGGNQDLVVNNDHEPVVMPKDFHEAQALLGKEINKKTPALAKALMEGITSGEITQDNIHDFFNRNRKV